MKHRRGIDLAPFRPVSFEEFDGHQTLTLRSLQEWEVVGAKCGKCSKTTWLDKAAITQHHGNQYLSNLGSRLRCECGNKEGNKVLVGKLGRD
ncbi:hypothetical protein [Neorhizobium galegae]|uniref:hypothetical protein n=1 Tax=Neorhizobium galegae TaxID=399 RepID=UPI002034FAAE|nr:hypothetical protein [Neorhizobium galegae]MCM2497340.1 hypothetical protein [Neorhizobium galegae]